MPIDYRIDHDRWLVLAYGRGTMTDEEVFGYQQTVWSRPDVAGYDELVDMTEVEHIALPSADRVQQLAALSAAMDAPQSASKFAIVAPQDLAFGLGRMYQAYRDQDTRSMKQVGVFRTSKDAGAFLGFDGESLKRGKV